MKRPKVIINNGDVIHITFKSDDTKYSIIWDTKNNMYVHTAKPSWGYTKEYLNEQYNNGNLIINYIKRN